MGLFSSIGKIFGGGGGSSSSSSSSSSNIDFKPTTNVNFDTEELSNAFLSGNKTVSEAFLTGNDKLATAINESTVQEKEIALVNMKLRAEEMLQDQEQTEQLKKIFIGLFILGTGIYYYKKGNT